MELGLLIAAEGHGPGRHGPVVAVIALVIVASAFVALLVSLVRKSRRRRGSRSSE